MDGRWTEHEELRHGRRSPLLFALRRAPPEPGAVEPGPDLLLRLGGLVRHAARRRGPVLLPALGGGLLLLLRRGGRAHGREDDELERGERDAAAHGN
jgi:hypothetical protein